MKKTILQLTLITLLVISSIAFLMLFAECNSVIIGAIEKVVSGVIVFSSIYGIDRLYSKYQEIK